MHAFAANLRQLVVAMARQAGELRLSQTASSLTVLSLMAIVPIAAVGLLLLTALPAFQSVHSNLQRFIENNLFLPSISATVIGVVNQFVASAERLSLIGTIFFFATALSAMLTIDATLNGIWRTARPRPLWQRLALYWSMLTLGPVLVGAVITLQLRLRTELGSAIGVREVMAVVTSVGPAVIGILALALLYRLAPNDRVRGWHALAGASLATGLLAALNIGLGTWIRLFPTHTLVYGAFATLPIFLTWLFAAWMSVLVGALLAANLRFWGLSLGQPHRVTPASEFDRQVNILRDILNARPQQAESARFRAAFDGNAQAADRVAAILSAQGYIVRVWPVTAGNGVAGVWDEVWLAAPGLEAMTLRPLFDRIWAASDAVSASDSALDPLHGRLTHPIGEVLALAGGDSA